MPSQRQVLVDALLELRAAALAVDVLDPQQEPAARVAGGLVAEQRRVGVAEMQIAASGWARTASPAAPSPSAGTGRKSLPLIMPALRVLAIRPPPIGLSAASTPDHDRRQRATQCPDYHRRNQTWRSCAARASGPSAGGPPRQLVVLLHGVGADGQRPDRAGADAGPRPAACPVRGARTGRSPATSPPMAASGSACRTAGRRRCWPASARTAPLVDAFLDAELARSRPRRRAPWPWSASRRAR